MSYRTTQAARSSIAPRTFFSNQLEPRGRAALVARAAATVCVLIAFAAAPPAVLAATTTVDLGQASSYAVLSGASVGNTVSAAGAPHTTLRGDLGVKPATEPTGFPPGVVTGATRIGGAAVEQAHADLVSAYDEVASRPAGLALAGDLIGATLAPGLHTNAGAVANTGTLTLDGGGDPDAVFVFQVGGALNMAASSRINLTNGARASRVFWQVNGAAAIGATAQFAGTLMALDAIAVGAGTAVNGRVLARTGAISLDANEFYSVPPAVTIAGGESQITTDSTPTITGTTDVEAPSLVTVTVGEQTLMATPAAGTWSVTSALLANGSYPVTAVVTDAVGNEGVASQQLTIDTEPPVIAIDGPAAQMTNVPTPTIAGTTDAAPGTIITVTLPSHGLTAVVQAGGTWNVTTPALADGTHAITATVSDPAGNETTAHLSLTLDTTAPLLTISGGPTALTNNATPPIAGLADVAPGTIVTIDLANETLTATVADAGAWTVTAPALGNGTHRVVVSVADAAGNRAEATQFLTVDTVSPVVAINGGDAATTSDPRPTIVGTSDAAPGTTVTVTIAGQRMTTLLQSDGSWNVTPTLVGDGTWPVVASVPDPAGNAGGATQMLTIVGAAVLPDPGLPGAPGTPGAAGAPGTEGATGATGIAAPATGPVTAAPTATNRLKVNFTAKTHRLKRGQAKRFSFSLSHPAKVTLTVRRGGKRVATAKRTRTTAGRSSLRWHGKVKGKRAPRGTYKVTLQADTASGHRTKRTVTLRVT